MKNTLLLPNKCRLIGAVLLPFAITWLVAFYFRDHSVFSFLQYHAKGGGNAFSAEFIFNKDFSTDFNGELSILATLLCLFMIAFSREKQEDEYVRSIRLHALQVSIYVNYIMLAIASILIYGFSYIIVLQASLFTLFIVFILVFYYKLYIKSRISKSQTA